MINLISIILVILITVFLLIYKRKYIINRIINKKKLNNKVSQIENVNKFNQLNSQNKYSNQKDTIINSHVEKTMLRRQMYILFKGSKSQKIKSLDIASNLSDQSTLPILKMGLKDMDSDIVKISAKLIEKFK